MIKDDQVNSFNEKGYLVVENLLPENILKDLQKVTDDFVEQSRSINENDAIFDLSDSHTSEKSSCETIKRSPSYSHCLQRYN